MQEELIAWKTNAWKDPGMVDWYHQRMQDPTATNVLKNEIEVGLCQTFCRGEVILDVGIGTGRASLPLARRGMRITGVDSSQAMLDKCAELAHGLPVALRQGDLTRLDFEAATFDTLIALNVLVHFPNWREILSEWRRVVRPGGRLIFDIHSLDHESAAVRSLGLTLPQDPSPAAYTCRIKAVDLAQTAKDLGLSILRVVPYGVVLGGGNPNYWLHDSLAQGDRFDRLMSWARLDERLHAFALFLEREVVGALTPTVAGRMMVILEKAEGVEANARWLEWCQAVDAALAREPVRYQEMTKLIPAWDAAWRSRLEAHLAWPRNRVLLHFLLSNYPGRVDWESFLAPHHAKTLAQWQQRYAWDLYVPRTLQRFIEDSGLAAALDYKGVNLRAGLEYELTKDMLREYFKAFP